MPFVGDAFTDGHIGLMDHLGIDKFMVLGYCIGEPFIWNLIKRAQARGRRRADPAQRLPPRVARPVTIRSALLAALKYHWKPILRGLGHDAVTARALPTVFETTHAVPYRVP